MKCPSCSATSSVVLETRKQNGEILRRRRCIECDEVYTTKEITGPGIRIDKSVPEERRKRPRKHRGNDDIFKAWRG